MNLKAISEPGFESIWLQQMLCEVQFKAVILNPGVLSKTQVPKCHPRDSDLTDLGCGFGTWYFFKGLPKSLAFFSNDTRISGLGPEHLNDFKLHR